MLVFRKELMLKRLEKENLLDKVNEEMIEIMDKLDGKEVYKNKWRDAILDEAEYIARDDKGATYPINKMDIEENTRKAIKKQERGCR